MTQVSQIRQATQPPQKNTSVRRPAAPSSQPAPANTTSVSPENISQLQRTYGNRAVQRLIQRAQTGNQSEAPIGLAGGPVNANLQSQIDSARGGGKPLDKTAGAEIGSTLGADFSAVRVHTNAHADQLNRSLSATAFTTGSDIFFSQGAYNPGTGSGQQLLAHELTHVVQQGGTKPNKVQAKLTVGPANDSFEQQANQVAAGALQRSPAQPGASGLIQRVPKAIKNNPESINSVQTWLRPLAEKGIGRKEYTNRLRTLIQTFTSSALNLNEEHKEIILTYLKAQRHLFGSVVLGEALKENNTNKRGETDFGGITNSASRWMDRSLNKYAKNRNWKQEKGVKKGWSALAAGTSKIGARISTMLVEGLGRSKVRQALSSSSAYVDLKDAYDALAHIFGNQLAKAFRPEAVLDIAVTRTATDITSAMDKKTLFQRWTSKRKNKKLQQDMNNQDNAINENNALNQVPEEGNNEVDEESTFDENEEI